MSKDLEFVKEVIVNNLNATTELMKETDDKDILKLSYITIAVYIDLLEQLGIISEYQKHLLDYANNDIYTVRSVKNA